MSIKQRLAKLEVISAQIKPAQPGESPMQTYFRMLNDTVRYPTEPFRGTAEEAAKIYKQMVDL